MTSSKECNMIRLLNMSWGGTKDIYCIHSHKEIQDRARGRELAFIVLALFTV